MTIESRTAIAISDDQDTNSSANPSFDSVLAARLSRRSLLKGSMGLAAGAFFGGSVMGCNDDVTPASASTTRTLKLDFTAVGKSLADAVVVPPGYTATVLFRLGDPIAAGVADYLNNGSEPGASFASRAGDHHDAIHYFGMGTGGAYNPNASDRGLLVMNHEAISPLFVHVNGPTIVNGRRTVNDEVIKELNLHGVSVIEVTKAGSTVAYSKTSTYNRRITATTEMQLSGPVSKAAMITKFSPDGSRTRGTVNNCAHGYTPWGTYLTCEENWAGYFRRVTATDNPKRTARELAAFARYGVAGNGRELWATATATDPTDTTFAFWNAEKLGTSSDGSDDFRNVANTYGWVVEIDPFAPASTPKKRTALGRFAHEGAWIGPVIAGRPLVWYSGDDSRNEYIYKYVSNANWDPTDASKGMAAGDKYLDDGKLYVAKFSADGTGTWLELRLGANGITSAYAPYAFADQSDVILHSRLAADAAGATKMDRPEWGAVNPRSGEVYMTLTNNNSTLRTLASTDGPNPRFYNDPTTTGTAQRGNPNGHIIRWAEDGGNAAATTFKWDIFLFGARSTADPTNVNVSGLTASNDFSSPDGLWFGSSGLLWIQTDDGAYTDVTNCMLLAAVPGNVGDGGRKTITNTDGATTKAVETHVGATLGDERLRRFLVGPKDCEITGIAETPDRKAIFVNIQHPGEGTSTANFASGNYISNWPGSAGSRPRSATIVITRNDGGEVGGGVA